MLDASSVTAFYGILIFIWLEVYGKKSEFVRIRSFLISCILRCIRIYPLDGAAETSHGCIVRQCEARTNQLMVKNDARTCYELIASLSKLYPAKICLFTNKRTRVNHNQHISQFALFCHYDTFKGGSDPH